VGKGECGVAGGSRVVDFGSCARLDFLFQKSVILELRSLAICGETCGFSRCVGAKIGEDWKSRRVRLRV
jgi:hypothetical protein